MILKLESEERSNELIGKAGRLEDQKDDVSNEPAECFAHAFTSRCPRHVLPFAKGDSKTLFAGFW